VSARVLVVAKAPVPGRAKTRLGHRIGHVAAAELAAAALLDTLEACEAAYGGRCHLALDGELGDACRGGEIRDVLRSWRVFGQRGDSLGERLAHAHGVLAYDAPGPVVQVGMDTPQLTPGHLEEAADRLRPGQGVVAPAVDGGWWLLGLAEPARARALAGVPMSTDRTGRDTVAALAGSGARVGSAPTLRDVDTVDDAALVAAVAPASRFAAAWALYGAEVA
jgi:rSAM/selenodomain-associated transferase 1